LTLVASGGFALQRTLKQPISCTGTGLHSGIKVKLTLHPAEPGTGIVFRRTDLSDGAATIEARWNRVIDTRMCTTVANDAGTTVSTVEHLMAAFAGYQIDNCRVDLDGSEVPIMDGSSEPFGFLIECAGTVEQDEPRRAIEILKPVRCGDDQKYAALSPAPSTSLSFEIDFENSVVARQQLTIRLYNGAFREKLARARTFGFAHEVEALRRMGLARGGSLDNAVVIAHDRILNREGLRFPDEFVRHKLLDALGDLYLAGAPIIGRFHGQRAGHALNNQLLHTLFAERSAWRWTSLPLEDANLAPRARRGRLQAVNA
jgi:UDP-3-O-[3-hydroxymyristoyl] N-acetylglucosamine deacetylase